MKTIKVIVQVCSVNCLSFPSLLLFISYFFLQYIFIKVTGLEFHSEISDSAHKSGKTKQHVQAVISRIKIPSFTRNLFQNSYKSGGQSD